MTQPTTIKQTSTVKYVYAIRDAALKGMYNDSTMARMRAVRGA